MCRGDEDGDGARGEGVGDVGGVGAVEDGEADGLREGAEGGDFLPLGDEQVAAAGGDEGVGDLGGAEAVAVGLDRGAAIGRAARGGEDAPVGGECGSVDREEGVGGRGLHRWSGLAGGGWAVTLRMVVNEGESVIFL